MQRARRWSPGALFAAIVFTGATAVPAEPAVFVEQVAQGITQPTNMVPAGDGSGRMFVTEQTLGRIRVYTSGAPGTPWQGGSVFLDLSARILGGSERGLLGLAFHPQYASNGYFFVYYTRSDGDNVLASYHVSANPNVADPASWTPLLTIPHPDATNNHNGGQIAFGPDGFLYVATGDGGAGGGPSQDLGSLLGKILRLNVNAGTSYTIPAGNPFVGQGGARGEVWDFGLRNPWRFSFDRQNGDLFIADVGQSDREEVNREPPASGGRNYGWPLMEGTLCPSGSPACTNGSLTLPILEYDHGGGRCSITGGVRARSAQLPSLAGKYLYADYCTGEMWAATNVSGNTWTTQATWDFDTNVSSFGEDEAGDVYVAAHSTGRIYRLRETQPSLTVADATVNEGTSGTTSALFTAQLSIASGAAVTVAWSTLPASADASDFVPASGTLTIPAGNSTGTIAIAVRGDTLDEPNEAFLLTLGPATNATLTRTMAQGTILDDDGRVETFQPIATVPFTITQQGVYHLVRNVSTDQTTGAAILIDSDFVELDLHGFKIGGGGAGSSSGAVGVQAIGRRNVTVRNGTVRGFLRGISLVAQEPLSDRSLSPGALVEDVRAEGNLQVGIQVEGVGPIVRRNHVLGTGGVPGNVDTYGLLIGGYGARVLENDVSGTSPSGTGTAYGLYSRTLFTTMTSAGGNVFEKNRLSGAATPSTGLFIEAGTNQQVLDNRFSTFDNGIVFSGGATGKYRRNLTSGVDTPFTGGTNAGGNQ